MKFDYGARRATIKEDFRAKAIIFICVCDGISERIIKKC